ncbi:Mobile element protein [Alloactinosynnema sp. L-07]|uniref:tyrosine-type recombinase/integrase n=1 Tax=Alloactinosynnema sp. L-07 TaxID=1653480 RepID=UPI00065EFE36|nr:site-specific integrase [Alloactinosynnema sp. L-07]CRK56940.1 Mobile element protein [Alloactinosynnema sp. L-07]
MAERYTLRNRRSPALRERDAEKRQLRSRFAIDAIEAVPAVPAVSPRPFGDLSTAPIEELVSLAGDKLGSQLDSPRQKRRSGARNLLERLEVFEGRTWQERWMASGLDAGERPVSDLDPDKYRGYNLTHGLKALLCLRVITPSLTAFRGNKFNQYPFAFLEVQRDPLLDRFFEEARTARVSERHQYRALADVCCALTTQGIALADLTPQALLFYANECRRLNLVVSARPDSNRFAGLLAWDLLHGMGHFPPGTPPTLRTYIYRGQKSAEEMVDYYGVRDPDVRQLIIDYLVRRQGDTDYPTREGLGRQLAGEFWVKIEKLAPGQRDLDISQAVYEQWREEVRVRRDGKPRADGGTTILLSVRSFYMDLQSWALEEPQRWARWAAPCPIPPADLRGFGKRRRRINERMADRVRVRQPLLPTLVTHVEKRYTDVKALLEAARATGLGEMFTHAGRSYLRMGSRQDQRHHDDPQFPSVRVRDEQTGEVRSLADEEESAFWEFAYVEVLRHTGVRAEELVELAHTSVRQYQRPNGEVIALLVIAPSKTDRERVIPMSAELFHVVAMIVMRQTQHGPIPLVPRYDAHERQWTAPMPYLFQRQIGGVRRVVAAGTILNNLRKRCEIIGETNPEFCGLHFTPHDFRRLFATDVVNNGLPIHIGAALLGHLSLQTTQGYVAVFAEDVIRHVHDFLARRRAMRPEEEYRPTTQEEWTEFEEHFDKRKVELGSCGRPYGTDCPHEHACLKCAQLHINPKMLPRLDELETDLEERRKRAASEGWLGEIEGIDRTLRCLRDKRADTLRITRITRQVSLGLPTVPANR